MPHLRFPMRPGRSLAALLALPLLLAGTSLIAAAPASAHHCILPGWCFGTYKYGPQTLTVGDAQIGASSDELSTLRTGAPLSPSAVDALNRRLDASPDLARHLLPAMAADTAGAMGKLFALSDAQDAGLRNAEARNRESLAQAATQLEAAPRGTAVRFQFETGRRGTEAPGTIVVIGVRTCPGGTCVIVIVIKTY